MLQNFTSLKVLCKKKKFGCSVVRQHASRWLALSCLHFFLSVPLVSCVDDLIHEDESRTKVVILCSLSWKNDSKHYYDFHLLFSVFFSLFFFAFFHSFRCSSLHLSFHLPPVHLSSSYSHSHGLYETGRVFSLIIFFIFVCLLVEHQLIVHTIKFVCSLNLTLTATFTV